jgi:hypothetical protein
MGLKNWLEENGFPLLDRKAVAGLILLWILILSVGGCLLIGMAQRLSPEAGEQEAAVLPTNTQTNTRALSDPVIDGTLELSPSPVFLPGELTGIPLTRTAQEVVVLFPTQTSQVFTPRPTLISTNTRVPTATWIIYSFTRIASTSYYRSSTPRPTMTASLTRTSTPTITITTPVPTTHIPTTAVAETMTPTATGTQTSTPTPTMTLTVSPTVTETLTPTLEEAPTVIPTETIMPTETETPTPTSTETETPTPTSTETETPTSTETTTPTATTVSTTIAFSADFLDTDTVQDSSLDLVQVDEDGENIQKILVNEEETLFGDWSPDGQEVVFEIAKDDGTQRLYTASYEGTAKALLANQPVGKNSEPRWSPDGQWIVHVNRNPAVNGGAANLWVIPTNGNPAIALTSSSQEDIEPSWSPDGSTIVFVRSGEIYRLDVQELYPETESGPQALLSLFFNLFTNNTKTAVEITALPQPLLDGDPTVLGRWPRYSPDAKYLVLDRNGSIIRLNLTTKVELDLTSSMETGTARTPAWSPDGQTIAFIFHTNGESAKDEIWLVSSTGDHRRQLVLPPELLEKHRPVWKP